MRLFMTQINRIKQFSDAFGPSGFEDDVVALAQEEAAPFCVCKEDHMRNLYLTRKEDTGKGVNIMLDAHSDEVGFIIQAVKPNGLLQMCIRDRNETLVSLMVKENSV